jgi:hypothetical protein
MHTQQNNQRRETMTETTVGKIEFAPRHDHWGVRHMPRLTCTVALTIGNEVFEIKGMSEYDARRMHMAGRVTPGISAAIIGEVMVAG